MNRQKDKKEYRYIKIQLPSRCAICGVMGDLSDLEQKCGEVFLGPQLSTICGKVEVDQFDRVLAILKKEFFAEEVTKDEYSEFSWSL